MSGPEVFIVLKTGHNAGYGGYRHERNERSVPGMPMARSDEKRLRVGISSKGPRVAAMYVLFAG